MLLLHARNVKKIYADRLIIEFDDLKIYDRDRIGIVGVNGAGKTTLMDILSGRLEPDEGNVKLYAPISYIKQFGTDEPEYMSGGEKTRLKIDRELGSGSSILLADEPTTNLDMDGISMLEGKLLQYEGALLLISHDREFLDKLCTRIIEIEEGRLKNYSGNYSDYKRQKEMERERQLFEYESYVDEKKRLERTLMERRLNMGRVRKTPKRMGNSEARLHKRSSTEIQEKLANRVNAVKTRIAKLEKKEKPSDIPQVKMYIHDVAIAVSKTIMRAERLNAGFGSRCLFNNLCLELPTGSRTALIGPNGSGKTTLMRLLVAESKGVRMANGAKVGYFSQELDTLDPGKTILENVLYESVQTESTVRTILARLWIKGTDVFKKVSVLSGGERVKVSFAKILVSDANLLLLDEPTKYLDLYSMEALQSLLKDYPGTILFVSHDRRFVEDAAERVMVLENGKITLFEGGYREYVEKSNKHASPSRDYPNEMLLRMRLAEIAGKLSSPSKKGDVEELDREYKEICSRLKELAGTKQTPG